MNYKKFGILIICSFIISLTCIILFVVTIDPYFHYHKPLANLKYELKSDEQRYQNYGIAKNFNYDAIITGTSMTENFKTSELDSLFSTNSIKISLSGAYFKEILELLNTAFKYNDHIKYVFQSLDYSRFFKEKDAYNYDYNSYPWYLYNETIFDDMNYVMNKEVFLRSIKTLYNKEKTTFDEYSSWSDKGKYGKEYLDQIYKRPEKRTRDKMKIVDKKNLDESIEQNIISLVSDHPETEFYFFYPPYSIYYWDMQNQKDYLKYMFFSEKRITSKLLEYSNVHIFSFLDEYDMITNLDNYKDTMHYKGEINSYILNCMKNGYHELKKENYEKYYEKIKKFYYNYDYDALFEPTE